MNRAFAVGVVCVGSGVVGYLAGITTAYPGRAFSLTLLMVGITLLAIGRESGVDAA